MNVEDILNLMEGEDCLVVGCGPSARRAPHHVYSSRWTIGCNRSTNFCAPDFAACVEGDSDRDVWNHVENANPFLVFTLKTSHPRIGERRVVHLSTKHPLRVLGYEVDFRLGMAPFHATIAALLMGFSRIGLIGVDLDERRFGGVGVMEAARNGFSMLREYGASRGQDVFNVNHQSRLDPTAVPFGHLQSIRPKGGSKEVALWTVE